MAGSLARASSSLETFRPLTHIEIADGKPFRLDLGSYIYEVELQKTSTLIAFFQAKDRYIQAFKKASELEDGTFKGALALVALRGLADLLWALAVKPRVRWYGGGWLALRRYRRFFFTKFGEDVEFLVETFNKLCRHQTHIFFLVGSLKELTMVQVADISRTAGDPSSLPATFTPRFS